MTQTLSDAERRDWLKLARTENVGPVTFDQLIQRFGTAGKALAALVELALAGRCELLPGGMVSSG